MFVVINLPFTHRFVSSQVNRILKSVEVPIHISSVRKILPGSVKVQGVSISTPTGDTIIYAGELKTHIRLLALMRSKVMLKDLELEQAYVDLAMDYQIQELNIASAFSSKKDPALVRPAKENAKWEISIHDADLSDINFHMTDSISGVHIAQEIAKVKLKNFRLSLLEKSLEAKTLELESVNGSIHLTPSREPDNNTGASTPWNFGVINLDLKDIDFTFENPTDSFYLKTGIGEGTVRAREVDLPSRTLDINKITLAGVSTIFLTGGQPEVQGNSPNMIANAFPWNIAANLMNLKNASLQLGTFPGSSLEGGEPGMSIDGINLDFRDFKFSEDQLEGRVEELSFDMDNGFSLEELRAVLESDRGHTQLKIALKTDHSQLKLETDIEMGFFDLFSKPGEVKKASLTLSNSTVSLLDISCFLPELQELPIYASLADFANNFEGQLDLENSVLRIQDFSLSQDDNFKLSLNGSAKNPFQLLKAKVDLDLDLSGINQNWINTVFTSLGIEMKLPDLRNLKVSSHISDTLVSPDIGIAVTSSYGSADITGSVDFNKEKFSLVSSFEEISLGELLTLPGMGSFTGKVEIAGSGFKKKPHQSDFSLQIDTLGFRDYNYGQVLVEGTLGYGEYEFKVLLNDPSLYGDLNILMESAGSLLSVKTEGRIFAQLNDLHLFDDTLSLKSDIVAQLTKTDNLLDFQIGLSGLSFSKPGEIAVVQQIGASFKTDSVQTLLNAESDFFNLDVRFSKPFDELDSLKEQFTYYIGTFLEPNQMHTANRVAELPDIDITGFIRYHSALELFLHETGLYFESLDFSLTGHSYENRMVSSLTGKQVEYKMIKAGELNARIADSAGIVGIKLNSDNTTVFSSPEYRLELNGNFANWTSLIGLSIVDAYDQTLYGLEVAGKADSGQIVFEIPSRQMILNGDQWKMDSPDLLVFDLNEKTFYPTLRMHTDSSALYFYTLNQDGFPRYRVEFSKVNLLSLVRKDLLPYELEGKISGSVDYRTDKETEREIDTDLRITDLRFEDYKFNSLLLDGAFAMGQPEGFSFDVLALLDSSKVEMKGELMGDGDHWLNAEFSALPIKLIQPFTVDYLSELGGFLSGYLNVSSVQGEEFHKGELAFNGAHLKINALNSQFRIADQRVMYADEKLLFKKFTVYDTLNKTLLVDGFIDFTNERFPWADLNISTSKLQVMSRPVETKAPLSGNVFVDSKFSIKGPLTKPTINGNILLTHGTEVYYRQIDDLNLSERDKTVRFVNHEATEEEVELLRIENQGKLIESSIETIVEIDPTTILNFYLSSRIYKIDLKIKGGGLINYGMHRNEQITLSGNYEISEGTASLKLTGWPNKLFQIRSGGYIRWDGLVEDPELRFEAVNKVSSSYTNPVDGKLRNVDFNVILQLSQRLSDLEVVFTIGTPDEYIMSIINTMSPDEQMRQAISILLFESIDLPGISSSSDYMTQQVNQLVASQLNKLTESTIMGVDISFGIDTYNQPTESGADMTQTSLSYEVKKSFLNDRAQIELSGRFNDVYNNPGASDLSLNNISFEYRLDSAATKFLKVYNEHTYEDVFEGEVIKTGVGFTHRKRYKKLHDIWRKKEKNKDRHREK